MNINGSVLQDINICALQSNEANWNPSMSAMPDNYVELDVGGDIGHSE